MSPAVPKPDSNSFYFPPDSDDSDSDDESSSDESLDHRGDIGTPARPAVDAVAPAAAPVPHDVPARPPSPVAPPRPPSPIGIGARLPTRTRTKPREWWKLSPAQLDSDIDDDIEDAVSQHQYCLDILECFGMADCKPISTPMQPNTRLTCAQSPQTPEEVQFMKSVPYLAAVGALMYLATTTRPDIAYTVGYLARFNSNPGLAHWQAVKHLLRYLNITYAPDPHSNELFSTFSDADHGGWKDMLVVWT